MKLAIGLGLQDSVPGEAFSAHVHTIIEAQELVSPGKDDANVLLITPFDVVPHDNMRQMVVDIAVENGCDRLFFMDDDTLTPSGGITRLMDIMDKDERKPVAISGFYLRRGYPYTSVWSCQKDDGWYQVTADSGLHVIHSSGLGCCLIDLKWLKKNVPEPWFRMKQDDHKTLITDDGVLFEGIRKAGGVLLGDGAIQCAHVGRREIITSENANRLREIANVNMDRMKQANKSAESEIREPRFSVEKDK